MNSNILVISDVHLGSPVSRVKQLAKVLKNEKYGHLIINGDLFDNKYIERYKKGHWNILSLIRKISKKRRVTFILGNHDIKSKNIIKILGIDFVERLELEVGGKKMLFMHFHQFDPFIFKHPWITNIAEQVYYFFQSVDRTRRFSRWLKRTSKRFLKVRDGIRGKALAYIEDKDFDCIFGGHIHFAEAYDNGSKEYFNSGSFCDDPCHYLIIDSRGIVTLKEI